MEGEANENSPQSGEQYELVVSGSTDVRSFAQNLSYHSKWHGKTEGRLRRWGRTDAYGVVEFTDVNGEEKEGYVRRWSTDGEVMFVDLPDPDDPNKSKTRRLEADNKIRYAVYEKKAPPTSGAQGA